jgi:hypothetical protein
MIMDKPMEMLWDEYCDGFEMDHGYRPGRRDREFFEAGYGHGVKDWEEQSGFIAVSCKNPSNSLLAEEIECLKEKLAKVAKAGGEILDKWLALAEAFESSSKREAGCKKD